MTADLPFMKNVLTPLAKSILVQKIKLFKRKNFESALINQKKEMNDIMKTVESLENSGLLIKVKQLKIKKQNKKVIDQHVIRFIRYQVIWKYVSR